MYNKLTTCKLSPSTRDNRAFHERVTRLIKNIRNEKVKHRLEVFATSKTIESMSTLRLKHILEGLTEKEEDKFFEVLKKCL